MKLASVRLSVKVSTLLKRVVWRLPRPTSLTEKVVTPAVGPVVSLVITGPPWTTSVSLPSPPLNTTASGRLISPLSISMVSVSLPPRPLMSIRSTDAIGRVKAGFTAELTKMSSREALPVLR